MPSLLEVTHGCEWQISPVQAQQSSWLCCPGPKRAGTRLSHPWGAVRQEKAPVCYRKAAPQLVWVAKHLGKMPVLPLQRPSSQSSFTGKHKGAAMSPGPNE